MHFLIEKRIYPASIFFLNENFHIQLRHKNDIHLVRQQLDFFSFTIHVAINFAKSLISKIKKSSHTAMHSHHIQLSLFSIRSNNLLVDRMELMAVRQTNSYSY